MNSECREREIGGEGVKYGDMKFNVDIVNQMSILFEYLFSGIKKMFYLLSI